LSSAPLRIGITLGDPAGIGPEIVETALASGKLDAAFEYRVIGQRGNARAGEPNPETALAARAALEEAAALLDAGEIAAVVTGPIHKARMRAIGFEFPGQTEFFARRAGVEDFAMCLTGGALTVALVTAHVPMKDVAALLTEREIIRIGLLLGNFLLKRRTSPRAEYNPPPELLRDADAFENWSGERMIPVPHIAIAGLNPHAGECGNLGREEIDIIEPAVKYLREHRPVFARFSGPISPDTVFHRAVSGEFDGVLCMYHDQGLIPLKLHAFDSGVNVTLGLPFPRTSPDHGTAFEIAGRGSARADSMIAAIRLAGSLLS
jgi:4-hydroxy-L-threonine phosphate dehydrogenase PdxA